MTERAVEITQTYSPAPGRTVIVESIPATEVTLGDVSETMMNFTVHDRILSLIRRALRSTDAPVQRLTYTAPAADAHSSSVGRRVR